jgi:release factor glutamine methyltransferase
MTWSELIKDGAEALRSGTIDEARTNAEYLAAFVLHIWNRSELREHLSREVSSFDTVTYNSLIERRIKGEPLQYIVGETEFFGLRLYTTPAALIPRPETEILVEEAIKELLKIATPELRPHVLDIGTGTGAIALAIAKSLPGADVVGIDLSAEAVALARKNLERLNLSNVEFAQVDLFDEMLQSKLGVKFDLIASNPPYISISEMRKLPQSILEYEPRIALTDESLGLSFYERIGEIARVTAFTGSPVLLELGYDSREQIVEILATHGIECGRIVKDLAGIDRVFVGSISFGGYQNTSKFPIE